MKFNIVNLMKIKAFSKIFCILVFLGGNFLAMASAKMDKLASHALPGTMQTFEGRLVKKALFSRLLDRDEFVLVDAQNKNHIIIHVKIEGEYLKKQADVLLNKEVVLVGTVELVDKDPFRILHVRQVILKTGEL